MTDIYTAAKDVAAMMLAVHDDDQTPQPVKLWLAPMISRLAEPALEANRFQKGQPIPEGLGNQADEYAVVREARLDKEKEAKEIKAREMEIYNCILSTLDESTDQTGASGKNYFVQRIEKDRNEVKDWEQVWSYILRENAFDLLQKRLNDKAVNDRRESEVAVPGIEVAKVPTLSFTKVKK